MSISCCAKVVAVLGVVQLGIVSAVEAAPVNLLWNPGFETGDFTSWTVGGTSSSSGVDTDGTAIAGADAMFAPNRVNIRSGTYAGHALVSDPLFGVSERITLTQTISVLEGEDVNVGFYAGIDAGDDAGYAVGDSDIQIFIDNVGLLASTAANFSRGSSPTDFDEFSGTFNTGARTSIEVTFALNGSGGALLGLSFDDFFFISEDPGATTTPVPLPAAGWAAAPLLGGLFAVRRKRQ